MKHSIPDKFEYTTRLERGDVTVYLAVDHEHTEHGHSVYFSLDSVYFEGVDVSSILSEDALNELRKDAMAAFYG